MLFAADRQPEILEFTAGNQHDTGGAELRWRLVREDGSDFPDEEHPSLVALRTAQPVIDRRMIGAHIVLDWRPSSVPVQVRMDSAQIDQIVTNLFVNARDAIKENGVVALSTGLAHVSRSDCAKGHACQVPGDYVKITVSDNGEGIDKKTCRIFSNPFSPPRDAVKGPGWVLPWFMVS